MSEPLRRSSRLQRRAVAKSVVHPDTNELMVLSAHSRPPWYQHLRDIENGRIPKCIQRILTATDGEISILPNSYLARAIRVVGVHTTSSSSTKPQHQRERWLIDYAKAVLERRAVPPNELGGLSLAIQHGYTELVKLLLLEAGCPAGVDHPQVLHVAVEYGRHDCLRWLFRERKIQLREQLRGESSPSHYIGGVTALKLAYIRKDVVATRMLREEGGAMVLNASRRMDRFEWVLKKMYRGQNIQAWSPTLHWSFPAHDRRMLNWLWYANERGRVHNNSANQLLPPEIWLRVFGFIGRNWWDLTTLKDQNGWQEEVFCGVKY